MIFVLLRGQDLREFIFTYFFNMDISATIQGIVLQLSMCEPLSRQKDNWTHGKSTHTSIKGENGFLSHCNFGLTSIMGKYKMEVFYKREFSL